jgi:hypothetical protein
MEIRMSRLPGGAGTVGRSRAGTSEPAARGDPRRGSRRRGSSRDRALIATMLVTADLGERHSHRGFFRDKTATRPSCDNFSDLRTPSGQLFCVNSRVGRIDLPCRGRLPPGMLRHDEQGRAEPDRSTGRRRCGPPRSPSPGACRRGGSVVLRRCRCAPGPRWR